MAAKRIVFAVGQMRFSVSIDFVGRHHYRYTRAVESAQRLQHVDRAHHVGLEGRQRVAVARAHQRLCRQMKDDFRLGAADQVGQPYGVANVE